MPGLNPLHPRPPAGPSQTRAIAFLAVAAFASQAMVRSADPLLPQIAEDMHVVVGTASIVISGYMLVHGTMQLFMGTVGDRFGKYRTCAVICACAALFVALCGLAPTLTTLTIARVASAVFAAWIIPLGMAYVGDAVPYERRQPVLARYLSGSISGLLFGQAAGGVLGDLIGWRGVFFVMASFLALAAVGLFREYAINPLTRPTASPDGSAAPRTRGLIADSKIVLANPWARFIILAGAIEFTFFIGVFAYIGADLRQRFGLSFTAIGLIICMFGIGGLIYSGFAPRLVDRLGQRGLALWGSIIAGPAYLLLAIAPVWWITPLIVTFIGLGFYMLHNTLQTNATQMAPTARSTGVGLFSAALYLGQTVGVAGTAPVFDRFGAQPAFIAGGLIIIGLGVWLHQQLPK